MHNEINEITAWSGTYIKYLYPHLLNKGRCVWCKEDHDLIDNPTCLEDFTNYWLYHKLEDRFISINPTNARKVYRQDVSIDEAVLEKIDNKKDFLAPYLHNMVYSAIKETGSNLQLMDTEANISKTLENWNSILTIRMIFVGVCFCCERSHEIRKVECGLYTPFSVDNSIDLNGPKITEHKLMYTEDEKYYFHLPCLSTYLKKLEKKPQGDYYNGRYC